MTKMVEERMFVKIGVERKLWDNYLKREVNFRKTNKRRRWSVHIITIPSHHATDSLFTTFITHYHKLTPPAKLHT